METLFLLFVLPDLLPSDSLLSDLLPISSDRTKNHLPKLVNWLLLVKFLVFLLTKVLNVQEILVAPLVTLLPETLVLSSRSTERTIMELVFQEKELELGVQPDELTTVTLLLVA